MGESIADIAERQHGVVAVAQLHALGIDDFAINRRVQAGYLHRIHRGVYAAGHRLLSMRGRYLAAVFGCGPDAVLSHRSGAHMWDLRRNSVHIEVTVPRGRAGPEGITVHRSRMLEPADMTEVDGIPVTSVARTLLDLASILSPRELGSAVDRAERLQLFDLDAMNAVLDRARGRRGAKRLRATVAAWRPADVRSELETRFHRFAHETGLPEFLANVLVDGEQHTHEVDVFWPPHGLIVQLDGFDYHRTRKDRERDATSDADLELRGHRVMRLTWGDVTVHPARTARRLRAVLT